MAEHDTVDTRVAVLEATLKSVQGELDRRIMAQEKVTEVAIQSAKEALSAALAASEKAIHKAEEANEKRFSMTNEFRGQLSDQARDFAKKTEVDFRFSAVEEWRRTVDAALTAAASKSGLMYAIVAMAIASGGLLVAIFNLFNKSPGLLH